MAEGRLVKKSIARDRRVAQLSPDSQHLFLRCIPFQDNEGRMPGDPDAVRELAAPLLPWSEDTVEALIAEWAATISDTTGLIDPLVVRYPLDPPCRWRDREAQLEFECRLALQFAGFKNQPSRLRRGAPSTLPPPPEDVGQWASGPVGQWASSPQCAPDALSLRARAPGLGSLQGEGFSKPESSTSSSLRTNQAKILSSAAWLDEVFADVFGRPPRASRREQILELVELGERVGAAEVRRLMLERRSKAPEALAYFLQPLRELAAAVTRQPRTTGGAGETCVECGVGGGRHLADCGVVQPPVELPQRVLDVMPDLPAMDAA